MDIIKSNQIRINELIDSDLIAFNYIHDWKPHRE